MVKNLSFLVVSHIFVNGPTQALVEYLTKKNKVKSLVFIGHNLLPLPGKENLSFKSAYRKGKLLKTVFLKNIGPRFSLHYFNNFLVSVWWGLFLEDKYDLFVGVNNLNTLSGLILKFLGKVKKVIYYSVDFVPCRFNHPLVNLVYHLIDRIVIMFADEVWDLSPRMSEAREKYSKIKNYGLKRKIVPMGVWSEKIKRVPWKRIEKHTLVFMGHLLKKQGVQNVIKIIPAIKKKIPGFKMLIVGTGEYEQELKAIAEKLKVSTRVLFTGLIDNHQKMMELISGGACAIAFYEVGDVKKNFTYYADPGKIKDYLGAGLPVIMTDVPHNAYAIEKAGCGWVITSDKNLVSILVSVMSDEKKLKLAKKKAISYSRQFDWNVIYNRVFTG